MASISLLTTRALNIKLESGNDKKSENKVDDFNFEPIFDEQDKHLFSIIFHMKMYIDCEVELEFDYKADFKNSEEITNDFRASHFVKVNAPAIAYPFLRSFVANILLQSGYDPIILPAVNFVKLSSSK